MKIDRKELLNGSLLLIFSGLIWWQTTSFPNLDEGYPGPALFPRLICLGFALAGIILIIKAWRSNKAAPFSKSSRSGLIRLGAGITIVVLYPVLHNFLTFAPTLGLICFGVALLLGVRIWIAGLMALLTVLFIFLTFNQLLSVAL